MNQLLNRIFGVGSAGDPIGFGTPGAELGFIHSFEPWVWAAGIAAIIGLSWWSYRSLPGSRLGRSSMMIMRSSVLIVLCILAMGPMLERQQSRTEQDWTLVLIDQSRSMLTPDVANSNPTNSNNSITRLDQLNTMLEESTEQWDELSTRKHVEWIGFGDHITPISIDQIQALQIAQGSSTNIGLAIKESLALARARPISSIVLISDGRSFDEIDRELINSLKRRQIPIFSVPLGNDKPIADVEFLRIDSPTVVFADDRVPMRSIIQTRGIDRKTMTQLGLQVEILDHATGTRLAISPILPADSSAQDTTTDLHEVTLNFMPQYIGEYDYDLRIVDKLGTPIDSGNEYDLNASNNQASTTLAVIDRPMRVLYIDGYPRWEQRYLKNLLLRESSITSSSLLLASTRRSIQDGDELISALPIIAEQWEPFDVIILGDIEPGLFSESQLDGLVEHISSHGAGLLWIAGDGSTPSEWFDTPIASLLPLRKDALGSLSVVRPWENEVVMRSTPEADRIGLLAMNDQRTGWLEKLSEPQTGWSKLRWALAIDPASLKPGVSILAQAHSIDTSESPTPLVTMMRFGSGRSIFVGTDEIWRWRYGRGEDLPERFWLPLIRSLGRGTIDRRASIAKLQIHPQSPIPNQPTQIRLDLFDQAAIDLLPREVSVEITPVIAQDHIGYQSQPTTITLQGLGSTRTGTWVPDEPGMYEARIVGSSAALSKVATKARVISKSNEQRQLDTNHALLTALAQETAGQVIEPSNFASIPDLIPNRARTTALAPQQVSLWDRPVSLIVLITLLLIEWVGRRRLRLI